jgi:hypothetical protein
MRTLKYLLGVSLPAILLAACGGGGDSSTTVALSPSVSLTKNTAFVVKQDDSITFTGTVSGGSGKYSSYKWTFTDGRAPITQTTLTPMTIYFRQLGSQTVTLEVTDANGKTSKWSDGVLVNPIVSNSGLVSSSFDTNHPFALIYAASAATEGVMYAGDPNPRSTFNFGSDKQLLKFQLGGVDTMVSLELSNDSTYGITAISDLIGDTSFQAGRWMFGQAKHSLLGTSLTGAASQANLSYVLLQQIPDTFTTGNYVCNNTNINQRYAYFPKPELQLINSAATGIPTSFSVKEINFGGAANLTLALDATNATGMSDINLVITENGVDKTYTLTTGQFSTGIGRSALSKNGHASTNQAFSAAIGFDALSQYLMVAIAYKINVKNGALSSTPDYVYRGVMMVGCS